MNNALLWTAARYLNEFAKVLIGTAYKEYIHK